MALKTVNGKRVDNIQGFRFRIVLPKFNLKMGFSKVSGLEQEIDVSEYREGDDIATMRKFPGLVSYPNVVLEKGLDTAGFMQSWFESVMNIQGQNDVESPLGSTLALGSGLSGQSAAAVSQALSAISEVTSAAGAGNVLGQIQEFRQEIHVEVYDRNGSNVRTWGLLEAWPCKVSVGDLDAGSSDIVIETLELCHEGLFLV